MAATAMWIFAMGLISLTMFIGLWGWGHQLFGWYDPDGQVQLAIFASFLFGIICGYRVHA
ncbi:MAG: hypothetical protein IT553_11315 [Sphingomonadaceae bacterium]|nr:hypothetical protein [Sphingomonadaceae bacterium]